MRKLVELETREVWEPHPSLRSAINTAPAKDYPCVNLGGLAAQITDQGERGREAPESGCLPLSPEGLSYRGFHFFLFPFALCLFLLLRSHHLQ